MRIACFGVLLPMSLAHPLAAQSIAPPPLGAVVRAWTPPPARRAVTGALAAVRGDSLFIVPSRRRDTVGVAVATAQLEVLRGTRSLAGRGAGIGLVGGVVAGVALGLASEEPSSTCESLCASRAEQSLVGGVVLGLLGAAGGALVGAAIRTERWEPFVAPRTNANGASRPAVAAGVRVAWSRPAQR